MRCEIVCELATNHGGSLSLAQDMVRAAADSGADWVKIQSYTLKRLNPRDPQADWLRQAHLDKAAHAGLIKTCADCGVKFLSTPFDFDALTMLCDLGVHTIKVASSESERFWWRARDVEAFVSWPWGRKGRVGDTRVAVAANLTAIPLYPTPLEAVSAVTLLDGWSDHVVGLSACKWAIANGAKIVEKHFSLHGRGRNSDWDMLPAGVRALRDFADDAESMRSGVAQRFRERWTA